MSGKYPEIQRKKGRFDRSVEQEADMRKGDRVSVRYIITTHDAETRSGIVEYVSRYGWVAVRFAAGYVEGFWRGEVIRCRG